MAFSVAAKSGLRATPVSRRSAVIVRASGAPVPPPTPNPNEKPRFTPEQWDAAGTQASDPAPAPAAAAKAWSFGDAMAFSGPAPELVNGRLAMLGIVSALGAELASGQSVVQQLSSAPVPIALTFVAFIVASLVPLFKGANLKEAFGPFTPQAEMINGRVAMLGVAALLSIELIKSSAFL